MPGVHQLMIFEHWSDDPYSKLMVGVPGGLPDADADTDATLKGQQKRYVITLPPVES